MKIIGLCGKARSGKTTAAEAIELEFGAKHLSFAEPLRKFVQEITGGYTDEDKEMYIEWLGASPRVLMQTLGTDWGREMIHDDIWVNICMQKASHHDLVVISDVRFDNEVDAIKERGGCLIYIERPGCVPVSEHISERNDTQRFCDYTIVNNGSKSLLERMATDAVYDWLYKVGHYQRSTP